MPRAHPSRRSVFVARRFARLLSPFLAVALAIGSLGLQGAALPARADTGTGCVSLTAAVPYTQDFDTLANAGTANTALPTGWYLTETGGGARDNEQYAADAGASNSGDTYSYGAASGTERALGGLRSGTLIPLFGACFQNNSAQTLTSLAISYKGEEWRLGTASRTDQLNFEYSTDATDLSTGTYVSVAALNFTTPNTTAPTGAKDGNAAANRADLSATVSGLTIAAGAKVFVRWTDTDASGSDDGLAVDDFSLTPTFGSGGGDAAPAVASTTPTNGATGVAATSTIQVTFSEPVTVSGTWFQIVCPTSGTRTVADTAISGGPTTFTIDPNADFAAGETCAVTVFAAQVSDVDTVDPPDNPAANYVFSFTVAGIGAPSARIHDIQGAAHTSPLSGQTVTNVPGIVTAVRSNGFFIQDPAPDADPATSEGVFVFTSIAPSVAVGDSVVVSGSVVEFRPGGNTSNNLTTTEIGNGPTVTTVSTGNPLPAPIVIGQGGRVPPATIIEDDATGNVETSGTFDPATDGLDFYESLEGMLVQVNDAVVVGPTNGFGEIVVLADNGANAGPRTARGGVKVGDNYTDFNPERIFVDDAIIPNPPALNVGDRFNGAIVGVLDYSFGNFKLLNTAALPAVVSANLAREVTTLVGGPTQLTVGTFNVENLDTGDGAVKFAALATEIVTNLRSPDVITLEEVQDNTGPTNNGVVDANVTLQTLIDAIVAAGGPTYQFRQINPVNNQDGGEPGGNIRVVFLFNPSRVTFVDRPGGSPTAAVAVVNDGGQPALSFSPGRINPTDPAFISSRKPLVGEFLFNSQRIFVVGNHFNSKGGDVPLFGNIQPQTRSSEVQRQQQAAIVRDFVAAILAVDASARIVVLGDLNDFEFSPAVNLVESAGLVNLMETLPETERYSYVFEGNSQVLDQVLVSQALARQGTLGGYDVVHVNAEFADQLSDHDPQVASFTIVPPAPPVPPDSAAPSTTATTAPPAPNGQDGWFTSDVTVTLTAVDGQGGSGVKEIVYSASGSQSIQPTTAVGSTATFQITAEGTTTITYLARDNAGNVEAAKTLTIKLDKTAPTAQNDQYTAPASFSRTMTVPPPQGVLANDSDTIPAGPLTALLVTPPTKGELTLNLDGSFTYAPRPGETGTDSFAYRARNSAGLSAQATATIAVSPLTPAEACNPRPPLQIQSTPGGGTLQVTIATTPRNTQQPNILESLTFDKLLNARVTVNGQPILVGQRVPAPANQTAMVLTIERITAGQGTTVELTAVDGCGPLRTFVGGGPAAF